VSCRLELVVECEHRQNTPRCQSGSNGIRALKA